MLDVWLDVIPDKPRRKSMFLGPNALRNLAATASRRRTEREAVEDALELLPHEMHNEMPCRSSSTGQPRSGTTDEAERAKADEIWSAR